MSFPRTVHAVHQIEITSNCNLRCRYCPSPDIVANKYANRKAVDISKATYERALEWVRFYVKLGTQSELNLAGIGESTLHPEFANFIRLAREAVGPNVKLILATNGLIHDEAMVKAIAPYNPRIVVSLHRPEKAAEAVAMYKKYGLCDGVSIDPSVSSNTWAGQVQWIDSGHRLRCQWLQDGKLFVLADGRMSRCCLDAQGLGILGDVEDPIGSIETKPYELCKKCYQNIQDPSWDQVNGVSIAE